MSFSRTAKPEIQKPLNLHHDHAQTFLSIVIPAYNAGKTIKRCIKSIYSALAGIDFEIVVVDNASADRTCAQVENFLHQYDNINLLRLGKNYGPGPARNIGFAKTRGQFVWFIDADDEIPPEAFKDLDIQQVCENRDIVMFKYNRCVSGYFGMKKWLSYDDMVMKARPSDNFTAEEFPSVLTTTNVVWNKLFRRESVLAAKMEFPQTLTGEDLAFVIANLCSAKSIGFIDHVLYTYHEDASQISRIDDERRLEVFKAFEVCEQWLKERNIDQKCIVSYNLCKAYNLLYTYKTVHESLREQIKESLDEHLMALDSETFTGLLHHPFMRKDLRDRMLKLRGINSKIADKVLPLHSKVLNKCGKTFTYAACWFFLFALSFFPLSVSDVSAADNLYIFGGGGGGGVTNSSIDGGCSGGGGGYSNGQYNWSTGEYEGVNVALYGGHGRDIGGGGGGGYIGDGAEFVVVPGVEVSEYPGNGKAGYDKNFPGQGGQGYGGAENGADGTKDGGGKGGSAYYVTGDLNKDTIIMVSGGMGADGGKGGSVGLTAGNVNVKNLYIKNNGDKTAAAFKADSLSAEGIFLNTLESYSWNWGEGNINIDVGTLNIINNDTSIIYEGGLYHNIFFDTINLAGGRKFNVSGNRDAILYAEYDRSGFSNFNTLNVLGKNASFIGDLQAAGKNLNFYIDNNVMHNDVMLNVSGIADITESKIGINLAGSGPVLKKGDEIILINAAELYGESLSNEIKGLHGVSLLYDFDYSVTDSQMIATVSDIEINPQTKALSEGVVASVALLTAGSDLISDAGVTEAVSAAKGESFVSTFGAMSGGKSRYKTGSHVDINGFSALAGLATGVCFSETERLAFGAFAEYGVGDYNSYNNFNGFADVDGDGDTSYTGLGLLGHFDLGKFYFGFSGRVGEIKNDFKSRDLGIIGTNTSYSTDCLYYGVNFGSGFIFKLAEKMKLDTYGNYSFIHQKSDDTKLSSGDTLKFDAVNSQRVRVGARGSYAAGKFFAPYLAANFEYEFEGVSNAEIHGVSIDSPSLEGATGVGEIGISGKTRHFAADLGVRGYAGRREGFDAMLKLAVYIGDPD